MSTIPPYTAPAWTSALTGVNPGRHGIYGFFDGNVQRDLTLLHPGRIRAAPVWEVANQQGKSVGVFNVPMTYPSQPLKGWMVSGMMTPSSGDGSREFCWPESLSTEILAIEPHYVPDLAVDFERDWRDDRLCQEALKVLSQRRRVLEYLLESWPTDLLFGVIEVPDRLQHVYYRYLDPTDELYESDAALRIRPSVIECFRAIDSIIGLIHDHVGVDGSVVICSDHGFTRWEMTVHLNALLEEWGFLRFHTSGKLLRAGIARKIVTQGRRLVRVSTVARLKRGQERSAVDWTRTEPLPLRRRTRWCS